MELRKAYEILEVAEGANEEAIKDARKLLAKVWHPDRHANDPELQKRAQDKLAAVNEAFEVIRKAGFPAGKAPNPEAKKPQPTPPKSEPPRSEPVKISEIEFVPHRRIRWSVLLLVLVAVGVGAYLAIVKLGGSKSTTKVEEKTADAAVDPVDAGDEAIDAAKSGKTFGLGSTHEDVLAAQGVPTRRMTVIDEEWSYGLSTVTFNKRGKVNGWWDLDDVLELKMVPSDPAAAARAKDKGSYGIGSSKDEVIAVQGTPNRITNVVGETWYFGKVSNVTFNGTGSLTGYHNVNNELRIGN